MTTEWEAWEAQFTDVDVSAIEREETATVQRDPRLDDLFTKVMGVADRLGATEEERRLMGANTMNMSSEGLDDLIARVYECARVRVEALKALGQDRYGAEQRDTISLLNSFGLIVSIETIKKELGSRLTPEIAERIGEQVIIMSMGLALGELVFGWSFKEGEPPRCALVDTLDGAIYEFKVVVD